MFNTLFPDAAQQTLSKYNSLINQISEFENKFQKLTDEQLKEKTRELKTRLLKDGNLENIRVESFALVREASIRVIGLRHFDVQLIGGLVLNEGKIA